MDLSRKLPRALLASLIATATFAGLGAAVASTAADGDELPSVIAVPEPLLGDRASYQAVLTGDWPFEMADGEPYEAFRFALDHGGPLRTADGVMQATDELDVLTHAPRAEVSFGGDEPTVAWVWGDRGEQQILVAGTNQTLGVRLRTEEVTPTSGQTAIVGVPVFTSNGTRTTQFRSLLLGNGTSDQCLALNPLQGRTLAVGDSMAFPSCSFFGLLQDAAPVLTAVRVEDLDGRAAMRLEASGFDARDAGGLTAAASGYDQVYELPTAMDRFVLWVAEGIPYPIQVEWADGGHAVRGALSGYEAGHSPRAAQASVPAPEPDMAPRPAWTLDDTGVNHHLPISKAYQEAAQDPHSPLFAFLLDNPDAYLMEAHQSPGSYGWDFRVTSSDETLWFEMEKDACIVVCLPPTDAPAYTYTELERRDVTIFEPRPDQLPDLMPTVAGLETIWAAYGDPALADLPLVYAFSLGCHMTILAENVTCQPRLGYTIGHAAATASSPGPAGGNATSTRQSSRYHTFAEFPGIAWFTESETHSEEQRNLGPDPPATTSLPPSTDTERPPLQGLAAVVPLSPVEAGGVGAFALALGLLYYFWPVVKGGALGLFSRHQGPEVLAQPQRARLQLLIQANPGIHFSEVGRMSGLPNGTLVHHLAVLEREGQVRKLQAQGYTRFYPRTGATPIGPKSAGARSVLAAIEARPGASNLDVAQATSLDPGTVHYHVQRLSEAGLVRQARAGRSLRLEATPEGQAALKA